jgi:hypothetical protein
VAQPTIFISHSSKPRDLPGDDRLRYAREVLRLIDEALRASGFDTWIDRERLHPGDVWNSDIHAVLNTCDGAVVLLDPVVLTESNWVLTEATVLAHRYATSPDFRLIPVLLGGASPQALQQGAWAPLRMAEIQPAWENPSLVLEDLTRRADDVADQVVGAFAGLAPIKVEPLLDWWVMETTVPLRELAVTAPHRLDAAADALQMDCAAWVGGGRRLDRLAFALLDGDRDRIPEAVSALAPLVNERADPIGEKLAGKVSPLWVRLETASGVARGLRGAPGERRILISTTNQDLASDIIHRAFYCSEKLRLARCTGENGENLDGLVKSYALAITKSLIRFGLQGKPPDVIAKTLARADPPPVALISTEGLDDEDLASLVDQLSRRFPGVVLALLSLRSDVAGLLPPPGPAIVEPPLTEDEVASAMIFRCQILELAGRDCPFDDVA